VTGPVVEIRHAVHDSLFTAYDDEKSWGIAHRIMMPHLTQSATDSLFSDMAEVIPDLTKKWSASPKQRTLITKDLDRLLLASCMQSFFNQRVHVLEGAEPPMINAMEAATMEAMKRPTRPKLLNWLVYQRRFDKDTKIMRNFAASVIKTREDKPETARKDILDAMLNGADPESGEKLTRSQVIDEIISIFIGAATAPNLLSYALYYLMENPTEITKAQEEIDRVVGDGKIDLEHLKSLHYVEAILRESLRLSATAPGFNIEPIPSKDKSPVLLGGGEYQIAHNQAMIAVLSQVNRDPAVFEDPEAFKPERVLGEKWDQLPAAAKKGFGNGKRECIGKLWAWRWSFFTLASILKDTKFEFADPNYKLESNGAFSIKPLQFYGLVGPRK
jgi:cytochrome P450